MNVRASEYLDAINHLPSGATLVFHDVAWKEYVEVLQSNVHTCEPATIPEGSRS